MSADATPSPPTSTATQPQAQPAPSPPPIAKPAPLAPTWEPLQPLERRILGVLIEKQKTSKSADAYPLTLNALVTGCNQKTNRDPVLDLDEVDVENGLNGLQKKLLVFRITGGRAERFRHNLYDTWTRNGPELAVLAELLLRGPQTKGDLRIRAARMDPIDTLESLEDILKALVARRLVVYLTEPDRRGALVSHGFHTPEELARLRTHFASAPASVAAELEVPPARATAAPAPVPVPGVPPVRVAELETKLATAVTEIDALKARTTTLEGVVEDLRKQLGLAPDATANRVEG